MSEKDKYVFPYSKQRIQNHKMWLKDMQETGKPQIFDISVDETLVVQKTSNVADFDKHEGYITNDTENVTVRIYCSMASRKPKTYCYQIEKKTQPAGYALSGPEMDARIDEKVQQAKQQWDFEQTKKELENYRRQLSESEDYIEKLKGIIAETKEKLQKAESLGDFTSVIKDLAPQFLLPLRKPSGANLSGAAQDKPKEEASFSKATPQGKPAEKQAQPTILDQFSEEELSLILAITEALAKEKAKIILVAELLNINTNNQKTQTNGKV